MTNQLVVDDARIKIGVGTYSGEDLLIRPHHASNRVEIGKFCSFANSVTIFSGGNHPMKFISTHPLKLFFGKGDFNAWSNDCGDDHEITIIGNDVWLGHGCTIMSGSEIGDGAVVGAHSVVRGRIPPYAIVIGNPAKVVKYRFDEKTINQLLAIKWWDWPIEKIKSEINSLTTDDLISFLSSHSTSTAKENY